MYCQHISRLSQHGRYVTTKPQWTTGRYEVSQNMYQESIWDIPSDFQGGLFAGTNPIWGGGVAPFGYIEVPPGEIGVHRIGLVISRQPGDAFSNLTVLKLPMYDEPNAHTLPLTQLASNDVQTWVPSLLANIQADSAYNLALQAPPLLQSGTGASCPLLRFAFYSSNNQLFAPSVPSPVRAKHLFGAITSNGFAHPTMTQSTDGRYMGQYTTVNGFCFCPVVQVRSLVI